MQIVRRYLATVGAFTGLPAERAVPSSSSSTASEEPSVALLPAVGWLVGLFACFAIAVAGIALPANVFSPLAAAVACIALTLAVFGAHGDHALGTMATALRLAQPPSGDAERLVTIMAILAKIALLAVLAAQAPGAVLCALFAGHVISRALPLALPRTLPFIVEPDRIGAEPGAVDDRALLLACAWCLVPLAVAAWARGFTFTVTALLAAALALLVMHWLCARRLKGYTRDAFDAAQPCCEIAFYFGAASGIAGA